MFKFLCSIITMIVLSLSGCGLLEDEEDYSVKPLDCTILVRAEWYEGGSDYNVLISLTSDKIYPCCNYIIDSDITKKSNSTLIDIRGIGIPRICATALGSAKASYGLKLEDGSYDLVLTYREHGRQIPLYDMYKLTISDGTTHLESVSTSFSVADTQIYIEPN